MILISKKNTKKLIKGQRYTVKSLFNGPLSSQLWYKGSVMFNELEGRLDVKNFTDIDGNPVPNIDINQNIFIQKIENLNFTDLKIGELLICRTNRYKNYIEGGMYKIEKLLEKESLYKNWRGQMQTKKTLKIKFEGCRLIDFNTYMFRRLNTDEIREVSLSKIIEDKDPEIIKSRVRKIEHSKNKTKDLLINLLQSINDKNRHSISIIDWSVKINNMDIVKEDFNDILDMKLLDILNMIESNE